MGFSHRALNFSVSVSPPPEVLHDCTCLNHGSTYDFYLFTLLLRFSSYSLQLLDDIPYAYLITSYFFL